MLFKKTNWRKLMALENYESPLGAGTAFFNKGSLVHFYLDTPHTTEQRSYSVGIQGLYLREGANEKSNADSLISKASLELQIFLDRLSEFEGIALRQLRDLGWPNDIPVEGSQLVFHADYGRDRDTGRPATEPARISFFAGGHLIFAISNGGIVSPVFDAPYLKRMAKEHAKNVALEALPTLQHKEFGKIERGTFVPLKRIKMDSRYITFNMYLPEDRISDFSAEMLDPFIYLREELGGRVPELVTALAPLRAEWLEKWLDPENCRVSASFRRAFPQAQDDGMISKDAFCSALWLSSICISPLGNGSDKTEPFASWDFHALPLEADNTIFVARTNADGQTIEICDET